MLWSLVVVIVTIAIGRSRSRIWWFWRSRGWCTISGTRTASVTVFGISFPFCSNIHLFTHIQYIYLDWFIRFILCIRI